MNGMMNGGMGVVKPMMNKKSMRSMMANSLIKRPAKVSMRPIANKMILKGIKRGM